MNNDLAFLIYFANLQWVYIEGFQASPLPTYRLTAPHVRVRPQLLLSSRVPTPSGASSESFSPAYGRRATSCTTVGGGYRPRRTP